MSCQGIASSGEPCGMRPLRGKAWCWNHDPENVAARQAASQRGGWNRRTAKRSAADAPQSLRDVESIQQGIDHVWLETIEQENSGQRSRTMVAVLVAALRVLEVEKFEERLAALEAQAGQALRGRAA
jgi:hypothetical protein